MLNKVLHAFPSYLPRTEEEFDVFCKDIFETYEYPDKPGFRKLVGQMLQHLGQTTIKVSKKEIAKAIRKAQVNELAYWMMKKADLEAKEEQEKQEATKRDEMNTKPATEN